MSPRSLRISGSFLGRAIERCESNSEKEHGIALRAGWYNDFGEHWNGSVNNSCLRTVEAVAETESWWELYDAGVTEDFCSGSYTVVKIDSRVRRSAETSWSCWWWSGRCVADSLTVPRGPVRDGVLTLPDGALTWSDSGLVSTSHRLLLLPRSDSDVDNYPRQSPLIASSPVRWRFVVARPLVLNINQNY